jgi:hypothetical protein
VEKAIGLLIVSPIEAFPGLGRKLPHYGKYSYLAFEGAEVTNTVKGQWVASDSPLSVRFPGTVPSADAAAPRERPAPMEPDRRRPLIELPAASSAKGAGLHDDLR